MRLRLIDGKFDDQSVVQQGHSGEGVVHMEQSTRLMPKRKSDEVDRELCTISCFALACTRAVSTQSEDSVLKRRTPEPF